MFKAVPAIGIVVQDVDHCACLLTYLAIVVPELKLEKKTHTTVPRVVEGQLKVSAAASIERRWRHEENIVHSG